MSEKKISIITINLNDKDGLKKTIDSVIKQSFNDFEFIVIDGGSTDGSVELIKNNEDKITQWVSEKDNGRYDAMNKGIERSSGEYLLFLNSGDYLVDENVLEKVADKISDKPVYFGNLVVDHGKDQPFSIVSFKGFDINLKFFLNYSLPHQASFIKKDLFGKFGKYDSSYMIHGDHEFFMKLMKNNIEMSHIDVDVAVYNMEGISANPRFLATSAKEKARMFEELFGYPSISFFTIVLNGLPFLKYHIEVFKKLNFKWHWYIVEGAAALKHDTAWSVNNGGILENTFHKNGKSLDGTTEYIDELKRLYPENITVYRKEDGELWDGKLEMVNAPIKDISEPTLLWQVDNDELWTLEQINKVRELFQKNPEKKAAYFLSDFFVGENLVLDNLNQFGNTLSQDWLRVWRFEPGYSWNAHEPPTLVNENKQNIAKINSFSHLETESSGLVFQHFAYVTEAQLEFKEKYYGLKGVVAKWKELQTRTKFPANLKDYFSWVTDEGKILKTDEVGVKPLAIKNTNEEWEFDYEKRELGISRFHLTLANYLIEERDRYITHLQTLIDAQGTILSPVEQKIINLIRKTESKLFPENSLQKRIIVKIMKLTYLLLRKIFRN